ncbi:MAG: 30S ribosomal protein S6 [Candidatus Magasanikbacteria bacterium RIFCSPHIGHO2_01_FULL_41_23]|uniref:Small ribosomal subunit protein bS6 n=1 Tax=Candidatus Magasanikbacteria bacterium RIFCSPLOWO2_01_FULL_40_15 TaxID=1798686 RepID=A0A1F6N3F6_9BACT|nr:MAG: 30S ribosomal protein S6 [Candidatus Magasanikbacteria bacterium RIFCSPHIGHO2_01_FULL_41_23]OGH76455.1 MAG: 30S ribosomal protein S6 [Candidatus Magasanikbacteria bacterium RIFCSPHIGHO2_12_FULL_41_16]OGH78412.1 MAG: 30S ribosomal protein S6 [Candidatus Magasanikbacteria bacterium RIFCSPLOWO2_01_FULL_40_15]
MPNYEILVVLPGTLTEAEAVPIGETVKETIGRLGVATVVLYDMGKSRLAYPIKHIRYGYFYIVQFSAEANQVQDIERKVRLINNILRLVLRVNNSTNSTLDISKLTLTPLANVVSLDETPGPVREMRREAPIKPKTETISAALPVSMEEIEEKLDQILEKDLEKV